MGNKTAKDAQYILEKKSREDQLIIVKTNTAQMNEGGRNFQQVEDNSKTCFNSGVQTDRQKKQKDK